jgi:UDP-glucose 4-epimerase
MATLNPSNVVNGNTIQASDVLQLFEAFGTGSQNITGLSMTGSITNANVATTATSASNITTAVIASGTQYLVFVTGSGTKPPKIASLLEYDAATNNLTVTASFATTASHALTGTVTQVGLPNVDIISESLTDNPITFYDVGKLCAELYLKQFVNEGWVYGCSLRLSNVYGGSLESQQKDRGIIDKVTQKVINGEEIVIYGDGNFLRDLFKLWYC